MSNRAFPVGSINRKYNLWEHLPHEDMGMDDRGLGCARGLMVASVIMLCFAAFVVGISLLIKGIF